MSGTFNIVMGDRGRLVVPAEVRSRTGLAPGTPLVLLDAPDGMVLMTREQLSARVRHDLQGTDLVSELLRDRRSESAREDAG
ncbi:AbrB/MazE/SpoVT family DNA-binding domain-containing protein [Candidatus Poriferisodalis sp.]|uniref:AbrB/MazE/SpoVT family DNA-binding domain-containing protein n=1 Tax=Candidatus Poriferisodalis sp. TaxID=3101277 RepID=UPI003B01A0A0